jgi:hypothetical protein
LALYHGELGVIDGLYVLRTTCPAGQLTAPAVSAQRATATTAGNLLVRVPKPIWVPNRSGKVRK